MKIAFVNSSYQLGGAETVARDLLERCADAGHATRLYVPFGKTYPSDPRLVPMYPRLLSRLHHTRMHSVLEGWAPRKPWTDRQFRALARGWPDLIHLHNFHGDYATATSLVDVARRKPLIWTLHGHWAITGGCDHPVECRRYEEACGNCPRLGVWPLSQRDDTAEQLELKTRLLGDLRLHVVAPARFLAERIARSRVGHNWQVHHIPNGVSSREFRSDRKRDPSFRTSLGLDPAATVVLVVNRNFRDGQKGFSSVAEALRSVTKQQVPLQVVLAGDGSDWAKSELPATLQPTSVGYVSSRQQLAALFEAADIFLFASPAENFPCVILEAMASGCCVVSTPTSGVVEQIDDGRTGVLSSQIDGPALGQALGTAVADPTLRSRLGLAARQKALTAFSLDLMVQRHLALYESVMVAQVAAPFASFADDKALLAP